MTEVQQQGQSPSLKKGVVKQVLSGDAIVLQGPAANGPPKEITIYLANLAAPRLARRPNPNENNEGTPDEPYAWECREFMRKKLVGQTIVFVREFIATSGREHGRIYLGGTNEANAENVGETAVAEGWLEVKPGKQPDENIQKLLEIQERAKSHKKGRWAEDGQSHIRNITWNVEDPRILVNKYNHKRVEAVVEQVLNGSTVRVFLLPDFEYVTIQLSGVKAPGVRAGSEGKPEEFGEEAKFYVETRLLQRNVEVVLESNVNQNFVGTVYHPRGNIALFMLRDGYAKCVEWSIGVATDGPAALREAENHAKINKLRLWRNYTGTTSANRNSFTAKVTEIGLGDSINVLKADGDEIKVYFSSLRPPRREATNTTDTSTNPPNRPPRREAANTADNQANKSDNPANNPRQFRPLYDIPHMFETREFLRKRLIGKQVTLTVDYVQPKQDQFPEKTCCTVVLNGQNIGESLIARGLARVIRHKQDDDNRSSQYDALLAAEAQAEKDKKGLWAVKSDSPTIVRIQELQGDVQRSKQFMPYLTRSSRNEAIVEFVSSGSRLRVYIPKETCIITFLLGGIVCPRGARIGPGGKTIGENEPFAEEAFKFTKNACLQHDVQVEVESMDKAGGFVGYLFVQNDKGGYVNLSEQLVENGLAKVHFTAERSNYFNQLNAAENRAKEAKRGLWKDYVENDVEAETQKQAADVGERKFNFKKVVVTEVFPGLRFAAQNYEDGASITTLMNSLQTHLGNSSNVLPFTAHRGQLAAAKFMGAWHRVRVESAKGNKVDVHYIDFGNRESLSADSVVTLPIQFHAQPAAAREYQLALVTLPNDPHYAEDAVAALFNICNTYPHQFINVEFRLANVDHVTLYGEVDSKRVDIGLQMVENGHVLLENRRESRFKQLVAEYTEAENKARRERRNIWQYGDFTGNEI